MLQEKERPNTQIALQNGEVVAVIFGVFRRFAEVDFDEPKRKDKPFDYGELKLHYFASAGTGFIRPDSVIAIDLGRFSENLKTINIRSEIQEQSYPRSLLILEKLSQEQIADLKESGYLEKTELWNK